MNKQEVVGITGAHNIFHAQDLFTEVLSNADKTRCTSDEVREHPLEIKAFAGLHETAHFIAEKLGLNESTFEAVRDNSSIKKLVSFPDIINKSFVLPNVKERIADAAESLYLLSNYNLSNGNSNPVTILSNLRQADFRDVDHITTSSVHAAIAEFQANPRHGISIVDATRWAANIISKQPNLINELKAAFDKASVLSDPKATPAEKTKFDLTPQMNARDALCTDGKGKHLPHPK